MQNLRCMPAWFSGIFLQHHRISNRISLCRTSTAQEFLEFCWLELALLQHTWNLTFHRLKGGDLSVEYRLLIGTNQAWVACGWIPCASTPGWVCSVLTIAIVIERCCRTDTSPSAVAATVAQWPSHPTSWLMCTCRRLWRAGWRWLSSSMMIASFFKVPTIHLFFWRLWCQKVILVCSQNSGLATTF